MSRSSGRRGQVEPTAALVVLLAVCGAVTTYAVAVDGAAPDTDRDVAEPTLDRVVSALESGGVVDPDALGRASHHAPRGYRLNVTVAAAGRRWRVGPTPPPTARVAWRPVGVRLGPARIRPGRVRVEVWT
jgi:hypothetical protein